MAAERFARAYALTPKGIAYTDLLRDGTIPMGGSLRAGKASRGAFPEGSGFGNCPWCGKSPALNANDRMRFHTDRTGKAHCRGSRQTPAAATAEHAAAVSRG